MLYLKSERALDPIAITILREMDRITKDCGIAYFIVGATARDILLTHVFGMDIHRATRDVDFAIAVKDWEQFDAIKNRFTQVDGFYASVNAKQRLFFRAMGDGGKDGHGYPFDLVPFGGVELVDKKIAWPPSGADVMNVAGYGEVLEATVEIEVAFGLVVPVASLAGLVALKIFAWVDRGRDNPKDAQDVYQIMKSYTEAGNMDRVYEENRSRTLEMVEYDPDHAGAILLGQDVKTLANAETYKKLLTILQNDEQMLRFTINMLGVYRGSDVELIKAEKFLGLFKRGLQM